MAEPIRDVEKLGQLLYDAQREWAMRPPGRPLVLPLWDQIEPERRAYYTELAVSVKCSVCPAGFVVVPQAEHDALMEALKALSTVIAAPELSASALAVAEEGVIDAYWTFRVAEDGVDG